MAAHGRPALRDLFDESPTPHIAHPPRTHHRDFYVATDGSFRGSGGGLGAVIETRDGTESHASRPQTRRRTTTSRSTAPSTSDSTSSPRERRETPPSASSSTTTRSPVTLTAPSSRHSTRTGSRRGRSPSRPRRSTTGAGFEPGSAASTRCGPHGSTAIKTPPIRSRTRRPSTGTSIANPIAVSSPKPRSPAPASSRRRPEPIATAVAAVAPPTDRRRHPPDRGRAEPSSFSHRSRKSTPMSLRVAVAAPFIQNGTRRLKENEFVVALSLDRDWFSPDQPRG